MVSLEAIDRGQTGHSSFEMVIRTSVSSLSQQVGTCLSTYVRYVCRARSITPPANANAKNLWRSFCLHPRPCVLSVVLVTTTPRTNTLFAASGRVPIVVGNRKVRLEYRGARDDGGAMMHSGRDRRPEPNASATANHFPLSSAHEHIYIYINVEIEDVGSCSMRRAGRQCHFAHDARSRSVENEGGRCFPFALDILGVDWGIIFMDRRWRQSLTDSAGNNAGALVRFGFELEVNYVSAPRSRKGQLYLLLLCY